MRAGAESGKRHRGPGPYDTINGGRPFVRGERAVPVTGQSDGSAQFGRARGDGVYVSRGHGLLEGKLHRVRTGTRRVRPGGHSDVVGHAGKKDEGTRQSVPPTGVLELIDGDGLRSVGVIDHDGDGRASRRGRGPPHGNIVDTRNRRRELPREGRPVPGPDGVGAVVAGRARGGPVAGARRCGIGVVDDNLQGRLAADECRRRLGRPETFVVPHLQGDCVGSRVQRRGGEGGGGADGAVYGGGPLVGGYGALRVGAVAREGDGLTLGGGGRCYRIDGRRRCCIRGYERKLHRVG